MMDQGNYYNAVMSSVEKLKSNPNNEGAKETLKQAYPLAVNDLLDKLENEGLVNPQFQNTNKILLYNKLNDLYKKIQESPAAIKNIDNPKKYYAEVNALIPLAAEEQYSAGLGLLSRPGRENSKAAYEYFLKASNFVPNYKDVEEKLDQSYEMALLKVYTELMPVNSQLYKLSGDVFYKEVINTLNEIENEKLIRFIFEKDAGQYKASDFDQRLIIKFEDFVVGQTHTNERVENIVSDSVKIGETKMRDGTYKDIYGIVKAELTSYRMEVISKGYINLNIEAQNPQSKNLMNRDFPGEYVWFHEWGKYNGDRRALTPAQLELCSRAYINPIPPQQMFVEFTKPIYGQLSSTLRQFYNSY
ncbi:MAG: hypothetical protein U5K51_05655 [Flavobacteriaceae bacterium]|nr:hypothetical protein [Flavobacteriaceae bacterium]